MRILKRRNESPDVEVYLACITTRSDEDTETKSYRAGRVAWTACITTRSDEDTETGSGVYSANFTSSLASPPDPMRILKPARRAVHRAEHVLASPPDPMRILKPQIAFATFHGYRTCITTRSDEDTETRVWDEIDTVLCGLASPPDPMRILKHNLLMPPAPPSASCITTRSDEDTETPRRRVPEKRFDNLHHHPIR